MSVQTDLAAAISSCAAAIAGYAAELAADSVTAYESYSLDGENVSREAWRAGLAKMIADLNQQMNELQVTLNNLTPYWVATKQVL